jgi:hypothetical protein
VLLPELDTKEGAVKRGITMPNDKLGVAKVKGIEPEQFFIFLMNTEGSKGPFMRTSDFLSEDELRSDLESNGSTEAEINSLIERARANPR